MGTRAMNRSGLIGAAGGLLLTAGLALACTDTPLEPPPTYTVGGTVSGLAGSGLVLRDNDGDDLPVSGNGPVTFATRLASGAAYSITVFAQPSSPAQHCTVTTGSGTMASANITTVVIVCASTYTVGGMVSGLTGSGLVLRDNDGDDLPVSGNGAVTFATPVASGASYNVTVLTQPSSPAQTCVVTGGSGTMASANITTVVIVCATTYTVGGIVSGLVGSGLVLWNNGGDDLPVSADGPVTFATPVASGAAYGVTVAAQPTTPAQTCVVTGGTGTMASANVTTVAIACVANGTLRVTAATTGPDASATYGILVNPDGIFADISANGMVSISLPPGDHTATLLLRPQQGNCHVTSPKSVSVIVASGTTTDIAFGVTCVANGTLRVTVATTGPNAPATYLVGVDPVLPEYRYGGFISSNGTSSTILPPGQHTVELEVPVNCTVTSPNNISVTVTSGNTTDLGFTVACQ